MLVPSPKSFNEENCAMSRNSAWVPLLEAMQLVTAYFSRKAPPMACF